MKFLLLFIYLFLLSSCEKKHDEDGNQYYYNLTEELSPIYKEPGQLKIIQEREFTKFEKTQDEKYLISSRYVEYFLNEHNGHNQISVVFELLKLNNDRYAFISMICNFNLALELEHTSPKRAMQFLDRSIEFDKKLKKNYYITHLYHAKGRFYYNDKRYPKALYYFRQALKNLNPDQKLYIASMQNNFGLVYDKAGRSDLAVKEIQKGIKILEHKKNPNKEEVEFINQMKDNLGWFYFNLKDYDNAGKFLYQQFEYYKSKRNYYRSIIIAKKLFDTYSKTGQSDKQKNIIDYLLSIESQSNNISDQITLNEIIQSYYTGNNNLSQLKIISEKLTQLYHTYNAQNKENTQKISDNLNSLIIKNIDDNHDYDILFQKKKNQWLISLTILCIIILIVIIFSVKNKIKNEKEIAQKQKELFESNEKLLKQNLNFQKEKVNNLHKTLNLKIDIEQTLLENLKKIKKNKNIDIDSEQLLRDLLSKVNNLILIDKRNYQFSDESYIENKLFIEKLADRFPALTNKELKLCPYFRMDLSSKEISSLENNTDGSIRVYKTKIRNKLGLTKDDDLSAFLNSI